MSALALIALFVGWVLAADTANATTYEDIAGQWCGDVTDYVFAPDTLTVKFHDNKLRQLTHGPQWQSHTFEIWE